MVTLQRGANANLTSENPSLTEVVVGLGWSAKNNDDFVSLAAACADDQKAVSHEHVAFFNQQTSIDGSVAYREDHDEDVEQIEVALSAVPEQVQSIRFIVAAPAGVGAAVALSAMNKPFIRVLTPAGAELVRFDLSGIPGEETAMIFGELYRHRQDWKFRAVGQGYAQGLSAVGADLGLPL